MGLIYRATNIVNGKIYVGKTTVSLKKRMNRHKALALQPCQVFHLALAKHGLTSFTWEVLEECHNDMLNEAETKWIALLNSCNTTVGYNRTLGGDGGSVAGTRKDSEEVRRKKSLGMMGKRNSTGLRVPRSEEHKKAISLSMSGKKRKPMSEQHKKAISDARKGMVFSEEHKQRISMRLRAR